MISIIVAIASYLLGSVPTAYLAARWMRGIDIRQRGSGQVGGSNVWHSVSRRVGVVVAVADIAKGAIAVLFARWVLGPGIEWQMVAGLAAIAGHNWSVFLRFGGGRGIATLGGVILVIAPRETVVFAVFVALGMLLRIVPVSILIGVASLPLASWLLREPSRERSSVALGCIVMLLLVAAKRVVPKRKWPSSGWGRVLMYRLLFDRDIRSREAWIKGHGGSGHALK